MYLKKETEGYSLDDVTRTIRTLIESGRKNPAIREFAAGITGRIDGRQVDQLAQMIFAWIRKNIRYMYDPNGVEWIQAPEVTLQNRIGDCDDFTVLAGSLLESIGIRTQFNLVKTNGSDQFSHVFLSYWSPLQKKWIAFDAIVNKPMGWRSPAISGERIMGINQIGFDAILTSQIVYSAVKNGSDAWKWLTGKKSVIGKIFGNSERGHLSSRFQAKYLQEAFSDFLIHGDNIWDNYVKRWWKGKDGKYYMTIIYKGKEYTNRTDNKPNSHEELIKKWANIILKDPEKVPDYALDSYLDPATGKTLAQIKAESGTAKTTTTTGTQTATTGTTNIIPAMPKDPRTIDNLDAIGLAQNMVSVTTTLVQLQVYANNNGIKGVSVPGIQPPSPVKATAITYWDSVNKYRTALQAAVSSGYSYGGSNEGQTPPSGGGSTQMQEAGMGTAGMLLIGAAAAGLFFAARK